MTIKETIVAIKALLPREQLRLLREGATWMEVSEIEDKVSQVIGRAIEVPEDIHDLYAEVGGEKVKEPVPDKVEPESPVRFLGDYRLLAPLQVCQKYNEVVSELRESQVETNRENESGLFDTHYVPIAEHRENGDLVCAHMESTQMMLHSSKGMESMGVSLNEFLQSELATLKSHSA